jgi:hypothetical protein
LSIGSTGSILSVGKRKALLNRELGEMKEEQVEELSQQERESATFEIDNACAYV